MKYILILLTLTLISCEPSENTKTVVVTEQIDLSVLDSMDCVYDWYIEDKVLHVRTVHDELKDELERLEYIKEHFYE